MVVRGKTVGNGLVDSIPGPSIASPDCEGYCISPIMCSLGSFGLVSPEGLGVEGASAAWILA